MSNPLLIPGNLNRVRGSIVVASNTALNITASYLGKDGISLAPEGDASTTIQLLTSTTISEEPYQLVTVTANITKSLALSAAYLEQIQKSTILGQLIVSLDTDVIPSFTIENASISNWQQLSAAGTQADFPITFRGYWLINNDLWSAI